MLAMLLINSVLVTVAVTIHYEFLFRTYRLLRRITLRYRYRVLLGVFAALIAHLVEIWLFGISYYLINLNGALGTLQGNFIGSLWDCVYFSFTTYSTVGYGDIEPIGHLRFMAGMESLTGLVLITWSASMLFLEMQRYWGDMDDRGTSGDSL
ncbi:MAG: two pore domain potassium channel family protein [Gammaproteobacteria bacterium]|nr:MAG: two pore domain potassium channel family protein [Gammaproteobacteria bacterium]RLA15339.1 MAG: two pore domain potassium channel family protein [Gammaproteobacteria bacterium]RLA17714.1 MAG: two pore domain potassium channel family protein [Gammaproteobacteria bacterium]